MTLEVVAHELGMSHSQLSRIERGQQSYNQDLLESLAEIYGCDVVDLLISDPKDGGMWTLLRRATPEDRRRIVAIADAMLK